MFERDCLLSEMMYAEISVTVSEEVRIWCPACPIDLDDCVNQHDQEQTCKFFNGAHTTDSSQLIVDCSCKEEE